MLQQLLEVTADGVIGPQTLAALAGRDLKRLAEDYLWARLGFDAGIAQRRLNSRQFLLAWVNRIIALHDQLT